MLSVIRFCVMALAIVAVALYLTPDAKATGFRGGGGGVVFSQVAPAQAFHAPAQRLVVRRQRQFVVQRQPQFVVQRQRQFVVRRQPQFVVQRQPQAVVIRERVVRPRGVGKAGRILRAIFD